MYGGTICVGSVAPKGKSPLSRKKEKKKKEGTKRGISHPLLIVIANKFHVSLYDTIQQGRDQDLVHVILEIKYCFTIRFQSLSSVLFL